jgi:phosphoglycerate dehydrogenase-like enzyme
MLKVAILDDYAGVALASADWSRVKGVAEISVFDRHLAQDEAADLLRPFDVLCTMRERMALPRALLAGLPNLKLILTIGPRLANLDAEAATDLGIVISGSNPRNPLMARTAYATPELAWGLIISVVRHIPQEDRALREGRWQSTLGLVLAGRTLGLLGLGRIGKRMAEYGRAFDMDLVAWSQNLTPEAAEAAGVRYVAKDELFAQADVIAVGLVLSDRTRGLVGRRELQLMKPGSYLVNTSRGPIVDEAALIEALTNGPLAGAGLDTFDQEPLPTDHPLRGLPNVVLTPHLGYVTRETLQAFYADMPEAIEAFARGEPVRVANPEVVPRR